MKSKKILTILLSLAIMFTFMPAMAFAAAPGSGQAKEDGTYATTYGTTSVVWSNNFTNAVVSGVSGTQTATVTQADPDNYPGLLKASLASPIDTGSYDVYFYDLNGADLYDDVAGSGQFFKTTRNYSAAAYHSLYSAALEVANASKPSYIADTTWAGSTVHALTNTTVSIDTTASPEAATVSTGESFTINTKLVATVAADGTANRPFILGTAPVATATIGAGTNVGGNWYVDSVDKDHLLSSDGICYDAKEHTVFLNNGFTTTYQKYDANSKTWKTVTDIKVKDAGDGGIFRATYINGVEQRVYVYFDATTNAAVEGDADKAVTAAANGFEVQKFNAVSPEFGFKASASSWRDDYQYELTEAQAADPTAFVEIKKIADADADAFAAYFKDFYKVTVVKGAADSNKQVWTIEPAYENFDARTLQNLAAKHKAILNNYNTVNLTGTGAFGGFDYDYSTTTYDGTDVMTVKVVTPADINTKDDDISFEGQTSFTYSGKKTTKKGVLKAKKTITVKATSDSGNAITYVATKTAGGKITVSKAGKITVKKGLKKGTYKVTVKAKTAAGNGYKAASEKQTYVIKIKK